MVLKNTLNQSISKNNTNTAYTNAIWMTILKELSSIFIQTSHVLNLESFKRSKLLIISEC